MICIKDKESLKELVRNNLNKYGITAKNIQSWISSMDQVVKEYNKYAKQRNYWVNIYKPFAEPKDGPQAFGNSIARDERENGENSFYSKSMAQALWQFEGIAEELLAVVKENCSDKEIRSVERKIDTRRNRLTK